MSKFYQSQEFKNTKNPGPTPWILGDYEKEKF